MCVVVLCVFCFVLRNGEYVLNECVFVLCVVVFLGGGVGDHVWTHADAYIFLSGMLKWLKKIISQCTLCELYYFCSVQWCEAPTLTKIMLFRVCFNQYFWYFAVKISIYITRKKISNRSAVPTVILFDWFWQQQTAQREREGVCMQHVVCVCLCACMCLF